MPLAVKIAVKIAVRKLKNIFVSMILYLKHIFGCYVRQK